MSNARSGIGALSTEPGKHRVPVSHPDHSPRGVAANFRRDGRLDDQLVFLRRFFEQPLPNAPVDKLAILRLDGEMDGDTGELLPEALSGGGVRRG